MAGPVTIRLEPPIEFIRAQGGKFREALEDLEPLWERFDGTMSSIEQERFATRGYGEWPELAASTLAEKERLGFPADPLIRTRDLIDSLTDPGKASEKEPHRMTWGTDVSYAEYHQDGGSVAGRPPQRKILDLRVEDRRRLEADMVSYVNEAARRTWGTI